MLVAGVMSLAFAVTPHPLSAAFSLALPVRDYPGGSQITGLPSTNHEVDTRLGPVHRSSFERLHRIDGDGWLQAGIWHFTTGRGAATWRHRTVFLYAINLFHTHRQAAQAVADETLSTHATQVSHLPCHRYRVSDVHQTLDFLSFVYREIQVEAYYEYQGVAPTSLAAALRHRFSTQTSHLVHFARQLSVLLHRKPTSTPQPTTTPLPTATSTVLPTVAPPPTQTATSPPTSTAAPPSTPEPTTTPVPTPLATSTPTSTGLVVQAAPERPAYAVRENATILIHVLLNGQPPAGASVDVSFFFPGNSTTCAARVDASGTASCSAIVPVEHPGTTIQVNVQVLAATGEIATANTSFTIGQTPL